MFQINGKIPQYESNLIGTNINYYQKTIIPLTLGFTLK